MCEIRLPESELKVMRYIWNTSNVTAKEISGHMTETYGWKKNTTYTVLNNLVSKGILERKEPDFVCIPLVTRDQVRKSETKSLLDKFYNGSVSLLFSSFLSDSHISKKELDEIKSMIEKSKE